MDATASALGFYLFGFAFAYGDDASSDGLSPAGNAFIGKNFFAMDNMAPTTYYNWVFQWTVSHVWPLCSYQSLSAPAQIVRKFYLVLVSEAEPCNIHAADKTWHSAMMQSVDTDCTRALVYFCLHSVMLVSCVLQPLTPTLPVLQFAATACTIVSGAIAERTRFEAYILYSLFMSSWVYPVLIHSIWSSSGWASAFR